MDQLTFDEPEDQPEPEERWLPVVGYPNYEVSDQGRVRSLCHMTSKGPRGGRILKPGFSHGYPFVNLIRDGEWKSHRIHRLLMAAFVGPCPPGLEVRHLDGVKTHCVLSNLAYGTQSENTLDRVRHGTHHHAIKTHCDHGHEFTEANTYIRTTDGGRECRRCRPRHYAEMLQRRVESGDTCSTEGCDNPREVKGKCKSCWSKDYYAAKMASAEPCTEPGCDKPQRCGGRCHGHYKKWLRGNRQ